MTNEQIKEEWNNKASEGKNLADQLHKDIESYYNGRELSASTNCRID